MVMYGFKFLAMAALSVVISGCSEVDQLAETFIAKRQTAPEYLEKDGNIRVVFCGTGLSWLPSDRADSCLLVVAGGQFFLFGAGEGAAAQVEKQHISLRHITHVFINRLSAEQFLGLGGLIDRSAQNGRNLPMQVFGPAGVEGVVSGFTTAYSLDPAYREMSPNKRVEARGVAISDRVTQVKLLDKNGVVIEAARIGQDAAGAVLGYTLSYKGKKVFIGNGVPVNAELGYAMQGADLAIHNAVNAKEAKKLSNALHQHGVELSSLQKLNQAAYQMPETIGLAKKAKEVDVKRLIITQAVPLISEAVDEDDFLNGMDDVFSGDISVAEDGMVVEL